MDGPARTVARQLGHGKGFVHNALTGKCRITMNDNTHAATTVLRIARVILRCAHLTQHNGIHRFQM